MDQEVDFDFALESEALAEVVKKALDEGDLAYFDRIPELFGVVCDAAYQQGVTNEALQLLIQYFNDREMVLSANRKNTVKPTSTGTGTLQ